MKTPQSPAPVAGRPLTAEDVALLRKGDVLRLSDKYRGVFDAHTGGNSTVEDTSPEEDAITLRTSTRAIDFFSYSTMEGLFEFVSRPASEQPVEAIGGEREQKVARIIHKREFGGRETWDQATPAYRSHCLATAADILAALSPASPARTPMGEPQVLKGVGKINGDGWKDTTTIGEVVYVWNAEKPSPYAPGQYPRIGNEGWSASTAQYDFSPASVDEVRALAAPTPMGRKVEAKWAGDSNVLRVGWLVEVLASDPLPAEIINGHQMPRLPGRTACWVRFWPNGRDAPIYRSCDLNDLELSDEAFEALAASSPSPAQGGIAQIVTGYRNMGPEGDKDAAIQHLCDLLSASPQPEAGEAGRTSQAWSDRCVARRVAADLRTRAAKARKQDRPSTADGLEEDALALDRLAPPPVQPVEGK